MPCFLALAVPVSLILPCCHFWASGQSSLTTVHTQLAPTDFLLDFLGYIRYFVKQREALVPSFFNHMEMCHHLKMQYSREALSPRQLGLEGTCRQDISTHFHTDQLQGRLLHRVQQGNCSEEMH